MKFKLRPMDAADAQDKQNPLHHSQSSSCSFFTEQSIPGYSNGNYGRFHVGQDMIRRRLEMREAIRREIEKERIREEIIAEEMARKRLLEAEVRNELRMESEMAMRRGGGKASPFLLPASHKIISESRFLHRLSSIEADEKVVMPVDEKCGNRLDIGGHLISEIRGFSVSPVQLLGDLPKITGITTLLSDDSKKEVIVLGTPDGETLSGTKRKSTPPISEGSSQPGEVRSKKKVKEEWSCAVCQVSTTSERGLTQHIQGKKHQIKEAALVAQKMGSNFGLGVAPNKPIIKPMQLALTTTLDTISSKKNKPSTSSDPNDVNKKDVMNGKNKRDKFKFWCEMCQVGAFSEAVMNDHKEGKKHSTRLVDLHRKGKVDSEASAIENTCDTKDKTETKSDQAVVVATDADKIKTVESDMDQCVANTTTTVIGDHRCI